MLAFSSTVKDNGVEWMSPVIPGPVNRALTRTASTFRLPFDKNEWAEDGRVAFCTLEQLPAE